MVSNQTKAAVHIYLNKIVRDHTDPYTGEINTTAMAAEATFVFDLDRHHTPEPHTPEWVYDYAVDVAEARRDDKV